MTLKIKILIITMLAFVNNLFAQSLSNKGREFWVGYGHHQFMETTFGNRNDQEMILYFSAEKATKVIVTIKGTSYREEYFVEANTVIESKLIPKGGDIDARLYSRPVNWAGENSEGYFRKHGIHIQSEEPIVAYAHVYGQLSSGSTMLMPVDTWGYSYVSLNTHQQYGTGTPGVQDGANYDCFSWTFVVAKEDGTKVRIVPSVKTRMGRMPNVPFEVTLNKGEIYQVLGEGVNQVLSRDLTGTSITSIANDNGECFPIGVFSGSSRVQIACLDNRGSGDYLIQQIFPYQAWGKEYLTSPSSVDQRPANLNLNVFRILVKDPTTIVKKNGQRLYGLNGNVYEYQSNTPDYIEADKPVMVAQYLPSASSCGYTGDGDPEMIIISPLEQSIKNIGFYRTNRESINYNFLSLLIPKEGLKSLTIDGQNNNWNVVIDHPNKPGYSIVVKRWTGAKGQCLVSSDSAFTAITYGLGNAESYGYNAGTNLRNLSGFSVIKNQHNPFRETSTVTCVNSPLEISVMLRYKPTNLLWLLDDMAGQLTPAQSVNQVNPAIEETVNVNGVPFYRVALPGYYKFLSTGTKLIKLLATSPDVETCNNTEEVTIEFVVKEGFNADFTYNYENCKASERVQFTGEANNSTGDRLYQWIWNVSEINSLNTWSGIGIRSTTSHSLNAGNYEATLTSIDSIGCIAETVKTFSIVEKPELPIIEMSKVNICEGDEIHFESKSSTAGIKDWVWDFGEGVQITNVNKLSKTFNAFDTLLLKHVVKFSETCMSDTAIIKFIVYANPKVEIVNSIACYSTYGIHFTEKSSTADDAKIIAHNWSFGDGQSSIEQSPTHTYATVGKYNVSLVVETEHGCRNNTAVNFDLQANPELDFKLLDALCENSLETSVAKASVLNGISGAGFYKGQSVSDAGIFNPATAGKGVHDIWYLYKTDAGCVDSVNQTIKVFEKPIVNLEYPESVCLNVVSTWNLKSESNLDKTYWLIDNKSVKEGSSSFSHAFDNAGSYKMLVFANNSEGCFSDSIEKTYVISELPKVDFELPDLVCMPNGKAEFKNLTDASGLPNLKYSWTFGDGVASNEFNASHVYSQIGTYPISLTVTTGENCISKADKTFGNFQYRPTADNDMLDKACQNETVTFIDKSSSVASTITAWNWSINNRVFNSKDLSYTFTRSGNYIVKHWVLNADGCVSDTIEKPVTVFAQPVIGNVKEYTAKPGTELVLQPTINSNSSEFKYNWTPVEGLSVSNILNPSVIVKENVVYRLEVEGENNCKAQAEIKINLLLDVVVPNAFSPNGDGINDVWQIRNISQYPYARMQVFDRYGKTVFEGNKSQYAWDGTYKGSPLPVGVYYYLIDLKNNSPMLKGSVTLIK